MPRLAQPCNAQQLAVYNAAVDFSYYPTYKSSRRRGLYSKIYTSDAWSLIYSELQRKCGLNNVPFTEVASYLNQAKDFYRAIESASSTNAKPLLLYYAILNLGKAYCFSTANISLTDKVFHGLSEVTTPGSGLQYGLLEITSRNNARNAFTEFMTAANIPASAKSITITRNAQQYISTGYNASSAIDSCVIGHRLWAEYRSADEHFVRIDNIQYLDDTTNKQLRLRIGIKRSTLARLNMSHNNIINRGLDNSWTAVDPTRLGNDWSSLAVFESGPITSYTGRATDVLHNATVFARQFLYRSQVQHDPFRLYYLCCVNPGPKYNQLEARYVLIYYFSSIVRYQPNKFDQWLSGIEGPFLSQFFASEPSQILFEYASLICGREVVSLGLA